MDGIMSNKLIDPSLGGVFECLFDEHFTLLSADDSLFQLLGYTRQEFYERFQNHLMDVIYETERSSIMNEINVQLKKGHVFMYENRLVCKDGQLKWIWISAQIMKGSRPYFHCIFHDTTKDKNAYENLIISEKRFQVIISQTQDVIFEMDVKNNHVYYSDNYEKAFGYKVPLDNFPASMFAGDIIYEEDKDKLFNAFQSLRNGSNSMQCEYRLKYRNQGYHWVEVKATAIRDEQGKLLNMIGIITDINETKQAILTSMKEADFDALSGLYNRRGFLKQFDTLLANKQAFTLILIDLDDFKDINDNLGHLEGDHVLYKVAESLKLAFHDQIIGRYGGDEFIICTTMPYTQEALSNKILAFQTNIQQQFYADYHIDLGFSVGASAYPLHGEDFLSLFDKADAAMYEAKKNGKQQFVMYKENHYFFNAPQKIMKKTFRDQCIEYILDLIMKQPEHSDLIPELLNYLGDVFNCDRISIYAARQRIYAWYRLAEYEITDSDSSIIETLFDEQGGIYFYDNVETVDASAIKTWLKQRQALAAVLSKTAGSQLIICIEDCHATRDVTEESKHTIQLICELISTILLKKLSHSSRQEVVPTADFDDFPACIYSLDTDQPQLKAISNKLLKMLGYENESQYLHSSTGSFIDMIAPEHHTLAYQALTKAKNDGKYNAVYQIIGKDKHSIWVKAEGQIIKDQPFIILWYTEFTEIKEKLMQLEHKEFLYRTALQKSHVNVWEYNVKEKALFLTESAVEKHSLNVAEGNMPETLIEKGIIHPMSIPIVRQLYQKLDEGIKQIQADVLTRDKDGKSWWWERINYHMIYDQDGQPELAVAIGEDVTKQKETQLHYQKELFYQVIQNKDLIASFQGNITKNRIDTIEGIAVHDYEILTYDDVLELQKVFSASQEDVLRVQNVLSKEAVISAYSHGENFIFCDYRRKDLNGNLSWVRALSKIFLDGNGNDLHMLGVLQNIDANKTLENMIHQNIERDPLTNVYSKETLIAMIERILFEAPPYHEPFALLLFHVDSNNFNADTQDNISKVLKELASHLLLCFSKNKLVGKLYAGEFAVFIYSNFDEESILRYINEIKQSMRMYSIIPGIQEPINILFGAVIDQTSKSFDELYSRAKKAMQDMSQNIYIEGSNDLMNEVPVSSEKTQIDLTEFINHLHYSSALPINMQEILGEIRKLYQGDRAYLYDVIHDQLTVNTDVTCEHDSQLKLNTDKIKQWAALHNEGALLKFKQLEELRDADSLPANHEYPSLMVPMIENHELIAVIGIDNVKQYKDQLAFLHAILFIMVHEQHLLRFQEENEYYQAFDPLTKVKNRISFFQYSKDLNVDALISLGVITLDINGLKDLNKQYGMAYGDALITELAAALSKTGCEHIYRYDSDEFLVIFENITYERFIEMTAIVKNDANSICSVAIGFAWAEKQISLYNLINSAVDQRTMDKQIHYGEYALLNKNDERTQEHHRLMQAVEMQYLKMYLQQKVNSANGHVVGAEALIRYQDQPHGLVGPDKFIPYLENTGLIFYVDFFIFEEVHKLLAMWRQKGIELIPISLNFSRVTLLGDKLVERMNQINQKYGIDRDLIEIEITENMGEIERNTIIKIGQEIKAAGYRLALDDFGAKYSNLSIISDLKFDTLKFDKGLVDYLVQNENARWILECIIALCKKMDIYNVAEGVEIKEQVAILAELGCTYIQGYYYSRPVAASLFDTSHNYREH